MQRLSIPHEAKEGLHDIDKSNMRYYEHTATRKDSFIEMTAADGNTEKFESVREIGKGKFGTVRLFGSGGDNKKTLAVKNPHYLDNPDLEPDTEESVLEDSELYSKEIGYLAKAYPDSAPYSIKHFINEKGQYDHRIVMPYFRGESMDKYAENEIHGAEEFALFAYAIGYEICRIHTLGFYHGDMRPGNVLCEKQNEEMFGLPSLSVHLIDFNAADPVGQPKYCTVNQDGNLFMLVLSANGDIYDHARNLKWCQEKFLERCPDEKARLDQEFPAFTDFYTAISQDSADARAVNTEFLKDIRKQFLGWQARQEEPAEPEKDLQKNFLMFKSAEPQSESACAESELTVKRKTM